MYFRFILAPFFRWSISFPDILDFYKDSEGGSYFSSFAFAICELCKRLEPRTLFNMDILTQLTCRIHVSINKKLAVILNWKVGGYFEFKCLAAILKKKLNKK